MIRWCRHSDIRHWAGQWWQRWDNPMPNRPVVTRCLDYAADRLGAHTPVAPGGRVVILLRVPEAPERTCPRWDEVDWLACWKAMRLMPEFGHRCDPVPGDPRFDLAWLRGQDATVREGQFTVGCVLGAETTSTDLHGARLLLRAQAGKESGHFPLESEDGIPLPLQDGEYDVADLAAAYHLSDQDFAPLLHELVWSGAVQILSHDSRSSMQRESE